MVMDGKKGSITLETAIIVPFIFMMLIAIILSFLLMYQKALLTRTASTAAKQAAEKWKKGEHITGEDGRHYAEKLSFKDLYEDFFDIFRSNIRSPTELSQVRRDFAPRKSGRFLLPVFCPNGYRPLESHLHQPR